MPSLSGIISLIVLVLTKERKRKITHPPG